MDEFGMILNISPGENCAHALRNANGKSCRNEETSSYPTGNNINGRDSWAWWIFAKKIYWKDLTHRVAHQTTGVVAHHKW